MRPATRRQFLRTLGAMSAVGAAAPIALNLAAISRASAQSAADYKALVCIFLNGGNDAYNTVLATDDDSWANYIQARDPGSTLLNFAQRILDGEDLSGVAWPKAPQLLPDGSGAVAEADAGTAFSLGGVLPITPATAQSGRSFALHPVLTGVRSLFNSGRLAVVANVGPLMAPTTKAQYEAGSVPLPPKLFSHNDQQSIWQSFGAEGTTIGWGGKLADLLLSGNGSNSSFTAISPAGAALWLAGTTAQAYQVSNTGPVGVTNSNGAVHDKTQLYTLMNRVMRRSRGSSVMEDDLAALALRSAALQSTLAGQLDALAPLGTAPYATPASGYNPATDPLLKYTSVTIRDGSNPVTLRNDLAAQLQGVARIIKASRDGLGVKRQVFFVQIGGFDTHDNQGPRHAELMAQLDAALSYFDATLTSIGAGDQVTTFTASDFGRAFASNGDGVDHGWGGHSFVMGGAVNGGEIYGTFPTYGAPLSVQDGTFASTDQINGGSLLPKIPVEHLGEALARWMGVSGTDLATIFPNRGSFDFNSSPLRLMING